MRTIVHLSDLHFGRVDPIIPPVLAAAVWAAKPDLVVISGDFTQRAKVREFEDAARFLKELPGPRLLIPGNHDVPLYDVARRWLAPLNRYLRHITSDLAPVYADTEMVVMGINTARALTFKNGRINMAQIAMVEERFAILPPEVTRIVVTHHPFDDGGGMETVLGREAQAAGRFARAGVDMVLSGHRHVSRVNTLVERHPSPRGGFLLIEAGTATSTRGRGETNAFNIIRLSTAEVAVTPMLWNRGRACFEPGPASRHRRAGEAGWSVAGEARE